MGSASRTRFAGVGLAVWFVAAGYAVAGGEVVRDQVLEIWFDQTGLLTDVQVTTSWGGPPSIGPEGSVRGAPPGA